MEERLFRAQTFPRHIPGTRVGQSWLGETSTLTHLAGATVTTCGVGSGRTTLTGATYRYSTHPALSGATSSRLSFFCNHAGRRKCQTRHGEVGCWHRYHLMCRLRAQLMN